MPTRALTRCLEPGCPNLVKRGRCPKHTRARGSSTDQGYGAAHRKWRAAVLERDRTCRWSGGCSAPATVADHVIPIKRGGARFDVRNGQGLCAPHHALKTATRDGGFGR